MTQVKLLPILPYLFCLFWTFHELCLNLARLVQTQGLRTLIFALFSAGFRTRLLTKICLYIKTIGLQMLALISKLNECNRLQKPSFIIHHVSALPAFQLSFIIHRENTRLFALSQNICYVARMVTEEQLYCTDSCRFL